jgi:glutamine synthetase
VRASIADAGQDHRLGANEAPPAIMSIFLGSQLEDVISQLEQGTASNSKKGGSVTLGVTSLPELPKDATDRNRTSPFAFTGNKFEFRALGSSMSLAFPNTVLNTIVAEAIDELADKLEAKGGDVAEAVTAVVKESYEENKQILFAGDNYDEEWHAEAEGRGLKNLKTTPDALPEVVTDSTVSAFERYDVLSKRELESRFEVWAEQYAINANIEAETTDDIARTMLLPAALRYLALIDSSGAGAVAEQVSPLVDELVGALGELDEANIYPDGVEGLELAEYARDNQLPAMARVRELADKLEKVVADDLWPLPKYSEILFIK